MSNYLDVNGDGKVDAADKLVVNDQIGCPLFELFDALDARSARR